jgi:peptidoglycan/LPS O-acetylase OafA/YrhL
MELKTKKLDSLQMVRAIAMLMVLFIHLDAFSTRIFNYPVFSGFLMPGGDAGVNIFFVLSGFIIFYVHKGDIGKRVKFFPYLIKRFSRIYPTYWAANLLIIPLHFLLPQFGLGDEREARTIIYSLLLLPQSHAPIIHAAWSLSNEIFFYLMFSLSIIFKFKRIFPLVFLILLGTIFNIFYSLQGITVFQDPFLNLIFSYHNFEFLLGCFSAYLIVKHNIRLKKMLLFIGSILILSMIVIERFYGDLGALRLLGYGIPAFFVLTSLGAHEIRDKLKVPGFLLPKALLLLGDASFSIYITHQLFISGIGRVLKSIGLVNLIGPLPVVIIIGIFTILAGLIFHLKIEKPLLYFSRVKLLALYHISNKLVTKSFSKTA